MNNFKRRIKEYQEAYAITGFEIWHKFKEIEFHIDLGCKHLNYDYVLVESEYNGEAGKELLKDIKSSGIEEFMYNLYAGYKIINNKLYVFFTDAEIMVGFCKSAFKVYDLYSKLESYKKKKSEEIEIIEKALNLRKEFNQKENKNHWN